MVAEHRCAVRLWVDDLRAFERLCPEIDVTLSEQWQQGVQVCHWPGEWAPTDAADVVIAAFACQLPSAYMDAMAARQTTPLWMNLDYLSAEDWVIGCHGLPSVKYKHVQKYFFFSRASRKEQVACCVRRGFWNAAGNSSRMPRRNECSCKVWASSGRRIPCLISLFAYENAGLASWFDAMAADAQAFHVLVPEGRVLGDVERWLGVDGLAVGAVHRRGALTVQVLPFIRQDQYDQLLWCCDFNAVRGEDSFVRAQWAGRPLLWHIYQQEEDVHLEKNSRRFSGSTPRGFPRRRKKSDQRSLAGLECRPGDD
nr:hypothetical protein GCM10020185_08020 [Pseudomonas brassicacearum subsp. brassicacearum]